jgi:integrase
MAPKAKSLPTNITKRGRNYYFRYYDASGRRITCKGCSDLRETLVMLKDAEAEVGHIRNGHVDPKAPAYKIHEATPLSEHLEGFRRAIETNPKSKRTAATIGHANVTMHRAQRVLELAGAEWISDIALLAAQEALERLRRDEELGAETINHHIRAVKSFARWLWKTGRSREHALESLSTSDSQSDRRRVRRALTDDEAVRLIHAAQTGPTIRGMTGPDRAMFYDMALGTGFRAEELRTLTPERFRLNAEPPTVTVLACYAKNGSDAVQPIRRDLADRLRPWLASKAPGVMMFDAEPTRRRRMAEVLRDDLTAAKVPETTEEGIIDVHALRHTYITNLVMSPNPVKVVQELARHTDPKLTFNRYTHVRLFDTAAALDALPPLNPTPPESAAASLAATGTEGRTHQEPFAPPVRPTGDIEGHRMAVVGMVSSQRAETEGATKTPEIAGVGSGRQRLARTGSETARVAELADAQDLGSCALPSEKREGARYCAQTPLRHPYHIPSTIVR